MNIVTYPNAKINIGLRITEKRSDGFHNLETLFLPIPLSDILEIVTSNTLSITHYGATYSLPDGDINNDLCIKAYNLLKRDFDIPPVAFHLYKRIPVGSGLGGGSSNAAFTIKGLNTLFSLGISKEKMANYASKLGSDTPFFIYNRAMYGEGRGEILSECNLPLIKEIVGNKEKYEIKITSPGIHVSTAEAYSEIEPYKGTPLNQLLSLPIDKWRDNIVNDFEKTIFKKHPLLEEIKNDYYRDGALYSAMSGSGSSVYAIFKV